MIKKSTKQYIPLSEFITEYSERNTENKYGPVAVGKYGIRSRESIYSKELASDYSKNKLIYKNTLTVGMGSKQIDIGVLIDDTIYSVSPAYHTYKIANINAKYLDYCIQCRNQDMFNRFVKRGSRQGKTVDLKRWLTYKIPVYNEKIQAEIVDYLNRAHLLVELRQKQLEKLDELVKARFVEMFGNEKEFLAKAQNKVSDICKSRVGIVIQPTQYYTDEPNGVRAFRSLNVKPFYINDSDWVYFSEADNDQLCRTQVKAGDVAVVRTGANLGDCCVIPKKYDGCNAIDILLLTCNDAILPMYLSAFINYPVGKQQIINVQRGGAIKHLNLTQLENSRIYVPEMELQQQFVNFVNQVNKSKFCNMNIILKGGGLYENKFFIFRRKKRV